MLEFNSTAIYVCTLVFSPFSPALSSSFERMFKLFCRSQPKMNLNTIKGYCMIVSQASCLVSLMAQKQK